MQPPFPDAFLPSCMTTIGHSVSSGRNGASERRCLARKARRFQPYTPPSPLVCPSNPVEPDALGSTGTKNIPEFSDDLTNLPALLGDIPNQGAGDVAGIDGVRDFCKVIDGVFEVCWQKVTG